MSSILLERIRIILQARPLWVLLGLLLFILLLQSMVDQLRAPYELRAIRVDHAEELRRVFVSNTYNWPPTEPVPRLSVIALPDDMKKLDIPDKKSLFFRTLLPLVLAENTRLREQREFVERSLDRNGAPSGAEQQRLMDIARRYGIEGDPRTAPNRARLLRRVDIVPPALVLAQAANESGWGTSRFAVQANNLFGVWTYKASEGLAPRKRADDARHFVRVYPSLQRAVRDYMHNLNIGHAYAAFRKRRAAMRSRAESLSGLELAGTLTRYSQRGTAYVTELRAMIRGNNLTRLNQLRLAE